MTDLVLEHLKRIETRLDSIEREITGLKSALISSHEMMAPSAPELRLSVSLKEP